MKLQHAKSEYIAGQRRTYAPLDNLDGPYASQSTLHATNDGLKVGSFAGRLSWPCEKGKSNTLQANLERLKTALLLMLSVLGYAKDEGLWHHSRDVNWLPQGSKFNCTRISSPATEIPASNQAYSNNNLHRNQGAQYR